MSIRNRFEVFIDILCRVPPLLILDKVFQFQFKDYNDTWKSISFLIVVLFTCKSLDILICHFV